MEKFTNLKTRTLVFLYVLIDILCVGAGMGVPIFCILLGFPLGWFVAKKISLSSENLHLIHYNILKLSILASAFTFLLMMVIWGKPIFMLFDPMFDFYHFGHPFILYDPKISFIGWLILMICISPFLQLLTTIFASFIFLCKHEGKNSTGN